MTAKRLGFFSRLLDQVTPGERYRLAMEQVRCAERHGFDAAWVAQHHFVAAEGGLPSPFVFLSHVAARTSRIRLGTGIITLPLETPLRVAEDAAVLDLLCEGRLELGLGTGGTPSAFESFGRDSAARSDIFEASMAILRSAWRGDVQGMGDNRLYPAAPDLLDRVWQATFSARGGRRAGLAGDGLMLSKTQPRPGDAPNASLADMQEPIIDAYLEALPPGRTPRILGSRGVFIADDRQEALHFAGLGLRRHAAFLRSAGRPVAKGSLEEILAATDCHVGTPDDVIASLAADRTLDRVTDISIQVHPMDPPHPYILRCIELMAQVVAPALGWQRQSSAAEQEFAVAS